MHFCFSSALVCGLLLSPFAPLFAEEPHYTESPGTSSASLIPASPSIADTVSTPSVHVNTETLFPPASPTTEENTNTGPVPGAEQSTNQEALVMNALAPDAPQESSQKNTEDTATRMAAPIAAMTMSAETSGMLLRTDSTAPGMKLPATSLTDGAFTFEYPLTLPKGRNDLTPSLALAYNSQNKSLESIVGFGWDMHIPSITRLNKKGIDKMFTEEHFVSSFDGELVKVSEGYFRPRTESGPFSSYSFNAVDTSWTLRDTKGVIYTFGAQSAARESDPADPAGRIYRWYLERITDTHGNTITYEYSTDGGRLYPARIAYAEDASDSALYEILFTKSARTEPVTLFAGGFKMATAYHISEIEIRTKGAWTKKYTFAYDSASKAEDMLLGITESGRDEDGQILTLPPTTFTYAPRTTNTLPVDAWRQSLPGALREADGLSPYIFADVNGDALPDLLYANRGEGPSFKKVYINNGATWAHDPAWVLPAEDFFTFKYGATAIDVNNDGLADLVQSLRYYTSGSSYSEMSRVYINTGNGWTWDRNWTLPGVFLYYGGTNEDREFEFGDINGDGLPDLLQTYNGAKVYRNTGSGWVIDPFWELPSYIRFKNNHAQALDINSDGLVDILWSSKIGATVSSGVFINAGNGHFSVRDWSGLPGQYFYYDTQDMGYRLLDLDNDTLIDIAHTDGGVKNAYVNYGQRWERDTTAANFPSESFNNTFLAQTDINGDNLLDTISGNNVFLAQGKKPYLMSAISYPSGGSTSVTYTATPIETLGSSRAHPRLPVGLDVVSKITHTGVGLAQVETRYSYEGGFMYRGVFQGVPEKKFAGFASVTETDAAGNSTKNYYHQGNDSQSGQGEFEDHVAKIGFAYRTELYDANHNKMTETIRTWDRTDLGADASFVKLARETTRDFEGDSSHRDKAKTLSYDMSGNLTEEIDYGEVSANEDGSFSDNESDVYARKISVYAIQPSEMPSGFVSETRLVRGAGGLVESWTKYYYDNLLYRNVSKGDLTKIERYANGVWSSSEKTYNSAGLVLTEKDPRGYVTSYAYDAYNLYPTNITNPLNQKTEYTYDYSSGKIRTKKDPNGFVFETRFDALDRVLLERGPDPQHVTAEATVRSFAYTDIPNAMRVQESLHLDLQNQKDTYRYYDGLGRLSEERSEMEEGNQYALSEYAYDARGLLAQSTLPYVGTGAAYSAPAAPASLVTSFTYDALGRKLSETNAAGVTTYRYNDWLTMILNPRGVQKNEIRDARGRLTAVHEFTSDLPAVTSYTWDSAGFLTGITDAEGNIRHFFYDELGRRIEAQDLHAPGDATFGVWRYAYDVAGNLTQVTDPEGRTTSHTYDALNRMLTEDSNAQTGVEATYTYDVCANGKGSVCTMSTGNGGPTTSYNYLFTGRISEENRTIGGVTYTTAFNYDIQNNPVDIFYPDGARVHYVYNGAGLLEKVEKKENGESAYVSVVDDYDYGPHGRVTYADFANNTATTYSYDVAELYRLRSLKTTSTAVAPSYASGGATTTTSIATSTVTIYAAAGDGYIYANNAVWKTAHDATSGAGNSYTGTVGYTGSGKNSSSQFNINRAFLIFNTSPLPDTATITDVKLNVFVESVLNKDNDGNDFLTVANGSQPSTSVLANADFDLCGAITNPVEGVATTERKDLTSVPLNKYLGITLNATGRGWVSKTGYTKLCLREGHDAKNDPYASAKNTFNRATVRMQNYTDTASDPYITITYTTTSVSTTTLPAVSGPILAKTVQDISYTYDPVGNITKITDLSDTKNKATVEYTYDALDRLVRASTTSATSTPFLETYTYSTLGNLLTKSDVGVFQYSGNLNSSFANPHAATLIAGMAQTYDKNGNVLTDGMRTNTWDYKNRLTQSTKGGITHRFAYDHTLARVSSFDGTATTTYPNDYYDTQGATTTKHIYAQDALIATIEKTPATTTAFTLIIHTDHLGGTSAVTNAQGLLAESLTYRPFGASRIDQTYGAFSESRKYIGEEYDTTGLSYLNARYYDGGRGRFMGQDPVFWEVGQTEEGKSVLFEPQLQNSYSYAGNNPVVEKDPTGRIIDTIADIGFIAYDLYKMGATYASGGDIREEAGYLGLDIVGALMPGVAGAGVAGRVTKIADSARKGRIGETASGIVKNTERIPSNTGSAKYRIPDGLSHTQQTLSEIKNTATLSLTNQMKDFISYSKQINYKLDLYTRSNTHLSQPLKNALKSIQSSIKKLDRGIKKLRK